MNLAFYTHVEGIYIFDKSLQRKLISINRRIKLSLPVCPFVVPQTTLSVLKPFYYLLIIYFL